MLGDQVRVGVENDDFVDTHSFSHDFVERLAPKEAVDLAIVEGALESEPAFDFLLRLMLIKLGFHNLPSAVDASMHSQLGNASEWFLGHSSEEEELVGVRHVHQDRTFSGLRYPSPVLKLGTLEHIPFVS